MSRAAPAVVAALLVLLAGCAAPFGPGTPTASTTGGQGTSATPSPTPPSASSTSTATAPAGAPYESLSDAEAVVATHRERLRAAGTVVRYYDFRQVTNRSDGPTTRSRRRTVTRLDFSTEPTTQYVIERERERGSEIWVGPERNLSRLPSGDYATYSGPGPFRDGLQQATLEPYTFGPPERVTVDGTVAYRYEVTGLTEAAVERAGSNVTVRNVTGAVVISPDGVIRSARTGFEAELDDEVLVSRVRVRYDAVGTATVERPDWYDDAVAALGPAADQVGTVERSSATLGATVTVTGEGRNVGENYGARLAIRRNENGMFRTEVVDGARTSCIVDVVLPEEFRSANLTLNYTESLVPSGEEENLSLVRFNRTLGTFVAFEDTVDTDRNQVSSPVTEGGVYFVMHVPTFVEGRDRDDIRLAPDATGVPDCGG